MSTPFRRLSLLTGNETIKALEQSRVLIAGLGGVGSWAAEALVRSGIGGISLLDFDTVCVTNINRQVQATSKTIGRLKTETLEERLKEINPLCEIKSFPFFFSKETENHFDISGVDFVIDAIDSLQSKLDLIEAALNSGIRLFSSMGMAKKLDPTLIKTTDIWKTSGCPLATLVRQGLRKRNCQKHFTVVYSPESPPGEAPPPKEAPLPASEEPVIQQSGKRPIGSAVVVTATAGMILASLVIREIHARTTGAAAHE